MASIATPLAQSRCPGEPRKLISTIKVSTLYSHVWSPAATTTRLVAIATSKPVMSTTTQKEEVVAVRYRSKLEIGVSLKHD